MKMKKVFIYFLCVTFLLMMGQFHWMVAVAKEKVLPIGEMVSKGTVKFEVRENAWRNVESSHFPIFPGVRIKTEKGNAAVIFSSGSQIEISPNSLFSVDQTDQIQLSQGSIEFRIPSNSEFNLKVGKLSISKSRAFQASRAPASTAPRSEETIGSISIHSNGAVTIKNIQGNLSILDENRVLLAGLSSKDSVTLPSTTVKTSPRVMTAQADETADTETAATGGFLGLSTWAWGGLIGGVVLLGTVVAIRSAQDDDKDRVPICP
ncbi:MAG: FecR domain-containing protein [Deltaproteobacteria bacterium]|nr:FecR domain-containing protein [Deltaproteobacteria bacterium]